MKLIFDKNDYNPLYWHLKKYIEDPDVRYIYFYGGSSAGKTYSAAQITQEKVLSEKINVKVFRKESSTVWDSVYNDFKTISEKINKAFPFFKVLARWIKRGDNITTFGGMDDPEKAKGLSSFKLLFLNELSKFFFIDLKEVRRRMRGIKGQTLLMDWNPISETHWIKTEVIDKDIWIDLPTEVEDCPGYSKLDKNSYVRINKKGNSVLIKTTYKDNFWIVGHPVKGYGFVDQNTIDEFEWSRIHAPYDYQVYGLGEWGQIKTGNEFWRSFSLEKHVKNIRYDSDTTIHLSIDNNALPYISIQVWQVYPEDKKLIQIDEIVCRDPDNTASRAGRKTKEYLDSIGYDETVYMYGDVSTKARNTIDDNKRSFYQIFEEELTRSYNVIDRMPRNNPPVASTGDFVNALYEGWDGWEIIVGDNNKTSISDYVDVKTDKDGGMLKKKFKDKELEATYEVNGHFSDCKRTFIATILSSEYREWKDRFSKPVEYEEVNVFQRNFSEE